MGYRGRYALKISVDGIRRGHHPSLARLRSLCAEKSALTGFAEGITRRLLNVVGKDQTIKRAKPSGRTISQFPMQLGRSYMFNDHLFTFRASHVIGVQLFLFCQLFFFLDGVINHLRAYTFDHLANSANGFQFK
jgi:hypothetical protein